MTIAAQLATVVSEIRTDLELVEADLKAEDLSAAGANLQAVARRALRVAEDLKAGREPHAA